MKSLVFVLSLLFSFAAQAFSPVASCSWEHRGQDRYRGDHVKALDAFGFSPELRAKFARRMTGPTLDFDEVVEIRRNAITGEMYEYEPAIGMMHFGSKGKVCLVVDRNSWKETDTERGLVYCEEQTCVLVPTVCGNVSLITRKVQREVVVMAPPVGPAFADPVPEAVVPDSFAAVAAPESYNLAPMYPIHGLSSGGILPIPVYIHATNTITTPPAFVETPPNGAVSPVPEPSTWAMMVAALLGLVFWKRKSRHERN